MLPLRARYLATLIQIRSTFSPENICLLHKQRAPTYTRMLAAARALGFSNLWTVKRQPAIASRDGNGQRRRRCIGRGHERIRHLTVRSFTHRAGTPQSSHPKAWKGPSPCHACGGGGGGGGGGTHACAHTPHTWPLPYTHLTSLCHLFLPPLHWRSSIYHLSPVTGNSAHFFASFCAVGTAPRRACAARFLFTHALHCCAYARTPHAARTTYSGLDSPSIVPTPPPPHTDYSSHTALALLRSRCVWLFTAFTQPIAPPHTTWVRANIFLLLERTVVG